jgi:hypothetical protein
MMIVILPLTVTVVRGCKAVRALPVLARKVDLQVKVRSTGKKQSV